MDYKISISDSKKYLIVNVFVEMTTELSREMRSQIDAIAEDNKIDRLLFDLRISKNKESTKEKIDYSRKDLNIVSVKPFNKLAYLVDAHDTSHSQIVAHLIDKGLNAKEFVFEEEARVWLEKG